MTPRRTILASLLVLFLFLLAGDSLPVAGFPQQCPPPTTIGSGLGAREVPYLVLAPSGQAFASQQFLLVNEFNRKALDLANEYCMPCVAVYQEATSAHIRYQTENISGWTELTMVAAGGKPRLLPPNTTKRAGKIFPPSPNVTCKVPPPLPPPAKPVISSIPPNLEDATLPPADCVQPNYVVPAGTVIAENSWRVPAGVTGQVPWQAIQNWVQNVYPSARAALLQKWTDELQKECNRRNPGRKCTAVLELPDDAIRIEQGETGTAFNTQNTIYRWRAILARDLTGSCQGE